LVSASTVLIIAANLLHWDVDYMELWTCLGRVTPAPLSLSAISSPCYPCAWGVQSGDAGLPIGLGREIRAWRQREQGRGTEKQLTWCHAAGFLVFLCTGAFSRSCWFCRVVGFGLYEATVLRALQATPQVAPMPTYDTSLPGLVSLCCALACSRAGALGRRAG
jgi:hypothetical protein